MLSPLDVILRLLVAAALGSLVGLERERRHWTAGLRTHMLVGVGSALFMIVSAHGFQDVLGPNVVVDPSRVAAQVVSGIGFLGAGTILLRREVIRGLTTAASLWTVAAIGLASGAGLYLAAVSATVLVLLILIALKPLERRFVVRREQLRSLLVVIDSRLTSSVDIESTLVKCGVWVQHIDTGPGSAPTQQKLRVVIQADDVPAATEYLSGLPGVEDILGDGS